MAVLLILALPAVATAAAVVAPSAGNYLKSKFPPLEPVNKYAHLKVGDLVTGEDGRVIVNKEGKPYKLVGFTGHAETTWQTTRLTQNYFCFKEKPLYYTPCPKEAQQYAYIKDNGHVGAVLAIDLPKTEHHQPGRFEAIDPLSPEGQHKLDVVVVAPHPHTPENSTTWGATLQRMFSFGK